MSAFVLLLLKIVLVTAVAVFFGCVLTIMGCVAALLFQAGRGAASWDPAAILGQYRSSKPMSGAEYWMQRARRIAFRAWLVALIAGVSLVVFALISGQT